VYENNVILRTDDRPTDFAFWKISNGHISATGHPIHFMFGSRVRFSRSADRMALFPVCTKSKMAAGRCLGKFQMAISPERVVRSTSCLIVGWGSWGRRIEWTYFWLHQIQDCGWPTFWKISNDHISATDNLIRFIFGSRVGFSRSADRMALFPVGPNPRPQPSAVLHNFQWPYL